MAQFKDAKDRLWNVSIDVAAVERVLDLMQIDLSDCYDPARLDDVLRKPARFAALLYLISRPAEGELSVEEFKAGLGGDVLWHAMLAFNEALAAFFPNPRARESFRGVLKKAHQLTELVLAQTDQRLQALDLEAEAARVTATLLASASSPSAGASPA